MNHNYSIIYNSALGKYQAVSEKTKTHRSKARTLIVTALMGLLLPPAVAKIELGGFVTHLLPTDGDFTVRNDSDIDVNGKNIFLIGVLSPQAEGNFMLETFGNYSVNGGSALYLVHAGKKGAIYTSTASEGSILVNGDGHYGIYNTFSHTDSTGKISIDHSSTINTIGDSSHAIYAEHKGNGDVTITSNGDLNTEGESASGIVAVSQGKITINNYANITVKHQGANGIVASSERASTTASAKVLVGRNAVVDALRANHGISLETVSDGQIQIESGAKVIGGDGAGIRFAIMHGGQSQYSIENSGYVSSNNDQAVIINGSNASSQLDFTNIGTVQGIITADGNTALNMNNRGELLLRHQSDGSRKYWQY